ncbi:MAG: hypothetical protein ABIE22_04495 [archaeon]
MTDIDKIFSKYSSKIEKKMQPGVSEVGESYSKDFMQFKEDMMPRHSRYEKLCNSLGSLVTMKVAKKDEVKIQRHIDIAHLDITPSQALTLALLSLLVTFFIGVLIFVAIYLITGGLPLLFFFLVVLTALFLFYYAYSTPARLANVWRLKASSQMVPAILYIVAYMKHTSNLERAIAFASSHLQAPLSLDFKKVFWDVETSKFSTVRESLDSYIETWRDYNIEFVESFHLIESSLFEPSEDRRIAVLERALQVILDGVYEHMLKYTHTIRSPLTNLYMLGIVLPTLALALLPLASTLLQGVIKWYHIFIFFNILIPFFVYYLTSQIMLKRPGGYGETDILEMNPLYPKYNSKRPYVIALLVTLPLLIIGLLPFLFQFTPFPELVGLQTDYTFKEIGVSFFGDAKLFGFLTDVDGHTVGPFGLLALILSFFIPLGIAMFFSISYKLKSKDLIKSREDSKQLEQEFTNALFQLGNRLGDGMPAEIAFARMSESSRGLVTEDFFKTVNTNVQQMGMSLENAIFHPRRGAIIYYPSALISISMKILVDGVKKGLQVAARSLMSISEYVKNIHKINQRLRDLLAEVVSDMKSNMTFLAPLLAGIVVGLAAMITMILGKLQSMFEFGTSSEVAGFGLEAVLDIFNVTAMIPPYYLQLAIGIYLVQIVFILTSTLVTVDAGEDRLKRIYETGRNLKSGLTLYTIAALIAVISLAFLAMIALGGMGT